MGSTIKAEKFWKLGPSALPQRLCIACPPLGKKTLRASNKTINVLSSEVQIPSTNQPSTSNKQDKALHRYFVHIKRLHIIYILLTHPYANVGLQLVRMWKRILSR